MFSGAAGGRAHPQYALAVVGGPGGRQVSLLLRDVVVEGRLVDVRMSGGTIAAIDRPLDPEPGDDIVDGGRGALLPGLHDHHIHLVALAAAERAPFVGPPAVNDDHQFTTALRQADTALGTASGCGPSATTSRSPAPSTAGGWTRWSRPGRCGFSTVRARSGCSTVGRWSWSASTEPSTRTTTRGSSATTRGG